MVQVTRLGGAPLVVNAETIVFVEAMPDTVLSLSTGHKVVVEESVEEIIRRVVVYRASVTELARRMAAREGSGEREAEGTTV